MANGVLCVTMTGMCWMAVLCVVNWATSELWMLLDLQLLVLAVVRSGMIMWPAQAMNGTSLSAAATAADPTTVDTLKMLELSVQVSIHVFVIRLSLDDLRYYQ